MFKNTNLYIHSWQEVLYHLTSKSVGLVPYTAGSSVLVVQEAGPDLFLKRALNRVTLAGLPQPRRRLASIVSEEVGQA